MSDRPAQDTLLELLQHLDAVAFIADAETLALRFVSDRAASLTGYPVAEWLSPGFLERRVHPDDRETLCQELRAAGAAGGASRRIQHRLITADGRLLFMVTRAQAARPLPGTPRELSGFMVDASAARAAEVAARDAEVRLRARVEQALARERDFSSAVLDTAGALVMVLDRDGRIVRFNRACERATGLSFEEVRGRPCWELSLPDEARQLQAGFGALRVRDFPRSREGHLVSFDGPPRLVAWSGAALTDDRGGLEYVIETGIDVTAERRAQQELKQQNARLAVLAEASRAFATGLDYRTTLDTVARRLAELIGDGCLVRLVTDDGAWLEPVASWHPDPERLELLREVLAAAPQRAGDGITARAMAAGEVLRLPRLSREQVVSSMQPEYWRYLEKVGSTLIAPLRDRGGAFGHITLLRDLPGQPYSRADKSLLEDLASRAAQAIENARLYRQAQCAVAARDEFLSIASHELRTPLGALKLSLENTRRIASGVGVGGGPSPFLPRVLETAERQGLRLEKLVSALLDVSRIQTGKLELDLEETDLGTIATEVLSQFSEELAMAGCVVSTRVGGPAPGIWDRFRIAQVVTNLVSNALKYGEGRPIEVRVESGGGRARLTVKDQGIGIPAEAQRHIFGRFERAVSSRNYGGLGLGLYIVKSIVDAHGGTVAVESELGAGSAFVVELPSRHVLAVEGRAAG